LARRVAQLKRAHPEEVVEVWAEDESRLGLKPVVRRVWTKRGERARALVYPRYEWMWLYAAVNPQSGEVFWAILPYLDAAVMGVFLEEFVRWRPPGRRVVLVMDGATAHRAKGLKVPEQITVVPLPPYSPELNPTERLWPLVREGLANQTPTSLDELEERLSQRCRALSARPAEVAALTRYHWWPSV
jgi:DDE superfamily endonuclease